MEKMKEEGFTEPQFVKSFSRNNDDTCGSCWGCGWETQFVKPCQRCNGTGKINNKTIK